jgi:hypothetical protein
MREIFWQRRNDRSLDASALPAFLEVAGCAQQARRDIGSTPYHAWNAGRAWLSKGRGR